MKAPTLGVPRGSIANKLLLAQALLLLPAIGVALRLLGFAAVDRIVSRSGKRREKPPYGTAEEIIDAVQTAARHVPGARCLPQALALKLLMAQRGHPAALRIGVARNPLGNLVAHAWVEGETWTAPCGDTDVQAYARLTRCGIADHDAARER